MTKLLLNGVKPPVFFGGVVGGGIQLTVMYRYILRTIFLLFKREENVGRYFGPEQKTLENYLLNYLQISETTAPAHDHSGSTHLESAQVVHHARQQCVPADANCDVRYGFGKSGH